MNKLQKRYALLMPPPAFMKIVMRDTGGTNPKKLPRKDFKRLGRAGR